MIFSPKQGNRGKAQVAGLSSFQERNVEMGYPELTFAFFFGDFGSVYVRVMTSYGNLPTWLVKPSCALIA